MSKGLLSMFKVQYHTQHAIYRLQNVLLSTSWLKESSPPYLIYFSADIEMCQPTVERLAQQQLVSKLEDYLHYHEDSRLHQIHQVEERAE